MLGRRRQRVFGALNRIFSRPSLSGNEASLAPSGADATSSTPDACLGTSEMIVRSPGNATPSREVSAYRSTTFTQGQASEKINKLDSEAARTESKVLTADPTSVPTVGAASIDLIFQPAVVKPCPVLIPKILVSENYSASLWAKALRSLPERDRQAFGIQLNQSDYKAVISQVLEATKKLKKVCEEEPTGKRQGINLQDVVDKVTSWATKYINIGNSVVQYDPYHLALPWAAVKLILQVAINHKIAVELALTGVELITRWMVKAQICEGLLNIGQSPPSDIEQTLNSELIELYATMLGFLVAVKKHILAGVPRRICLAFSPEPVELDGCLRSIERQGSKVLQTVNLMRAERQEYNPLISKPDGQNSSPPNSKIDMTQPWQQKWDKLIEILDDLEEHLLSFVNMYPDNERFKILRWLSTIEHLDHHKAIQQGMLDNTGGWLVEKQEFKDWESSEESKILWLHGPPGAGKTKLVSMVIERFISDGKEPQADSVAFFYCNRDKEARRDPSIILSSIVKQLSTSNNALGLPNVIISKHKQRLEQGSTRALHFDECLDLIVQLSAMHNRTIILIDALDETNKEQRRDLLKALKYVIVHSRRVVKVFVSSRDKKDISHKLEDLPNLYIRARDNSADIKRFIAREIERIIDEDKILLDGDVPDDLRERIHSTLVEKSNGMFQWVVLQIKYLCEFHLKEDIERNLGRLPETLKETYSAIYKRVENEKGYAPVLARKALLWLMCSRRPLKPQDWVQAVTWEAAIDSLGEDFKIDQLLHLCRFLVVVDDESNVIQFAHFSVREFLETQFTEERAHFEVAECCAALINRQSKEGGIIDTNEGFIELRDWERLITGEPIFDLYPLKYLTTHVKLALAGSNLSAAWRWNHLSKFLGNSESYSLRLKSSMGISSDILQTRGHSLIISRELTVSPLALHKLYVRRRRGADELAKHLEYRVSA